MKSKMALILFVVGASLVASCTTAPDNVQARMSRQPIDQPIEMVPAPPDENAQARSDSAVAWRMEFVASMETALSRRRDHKEKSAAESGAIL